ncbi:MAG: hypothetical protein IKR17_05920 [Bacteroidales bacterium]|nr:hypothetical protein [Bacteroidales bacterium]
MVTTETKNRIVGGLNKVNMFSHYTFTVEEEELQNGESTWRILAKVASKTADGIPLNYIHDDTMKWLLAIGEAQRALVDTDQPCWFMSFNIIVDPIDGLMTIDIH